ncbi:MAG: RidA family protein [Bacteroidota bacterium]
MDIYERLNELKIEIPPPIVRPDNWKLEPFQVHENLLFLSGHGPRSTYEVEFNGRLGDNMTIQEGKEAAKLCVLNLLSSAQIKLKDLNRINKVIKVFGMVKCTPDFHSQPEVINGASELLLNIFGDNGKHARTAVGMYDLPRGISVEIEMIVSFI